MSLIEKMRSSTESTSTRFIIGMVVLLFVVVGGKRSQAAGCAGGMAATVNGETISKADYDRAIRAKGARRSGLTDAQRASVAEEALTGLIQNRAVMQEAERLGLTVSGDEVARAIKKNEIFQKDGKFDEAIYLAWLEEREVDRAEFELSQQDELLFARLDDVVGRGAVVTEGEVHRAWAEHSTQLDVTYIRLPPANFYADIVVSDADRDAYVTSHADAIAAKYKEDYDRSYNLPKRFTLHTILLRTDIGEVDKAEVKARAEAIAAQAQAPGADFEALATRWSEDLTAKGGGELGTVPADSLDPTLATAADAAGAGKVTGAIETGRGFQILKVDAIEASKVIAPEEANAGIAVQMIKEERVSGVVSEYATRLITAWTANAGAVPRDLTEAKALAVEETGPFSLDSVIVPKISSAAPAPELTAALRLAKSGDVLAVPFSIKGMQYVVQLSHRDEADEAIYGIASGSTRQQLLHMRQKSFVEAWIAQVTKSARVQRYVVTGKTN